MILKVLQQLFKDILRINDFSTDLSLENGDWGSLKHFELICAVEDEFKIRFEATEIEEVTSVKTLYKTIKEKLDA